MPKKLCTLASATAVAAGSTPLLSLMAAYNTGEATAGRPAMGYGQVPLVNTLSYTNPDDAAFLADSTAKTLYAQLCAYRGS